MSAFCRRKLLTTALGATIAGGISIVASPLIASSNQNKFIEEKPFSWIPRKLNPTKCMTIARESFYEQGYGCAYGVFYATVGTLAKQYGAPYNSFPFSMMEFGKDGVSEWGTTCGALLGAASVLALFWGRKERDPMVDELFKWYEITAFPIFSPTKDSKVGLNTELPTSISGSVLCHITTSKWCYSSGFSANSAEKTEYCSRITADVTKKLCEIINSKLNNQFEKKYTSSKIKEDSLILANTKMDCKTCHMSSIEKKK